MNPSCNLIFPDGVRLARLDELPGPDPARIEAWERIKSANICSGFCTTSSDDPKFSVYAEANVDAPDIWSVFLSLSEVLLGDSTCLLIGDVDEEPAHIGPFPTSSLLALLNPHRYQLTNDGSVTFGLIDERPDAIAEILVTPTKHFKVWANDEKALRTVFSRHGVEQARELRFLDEFPRITESLGPKQGVALQPEELIRLLRDGPKQPRN